MTSFDLRTVTKCHECQSHYARHLDECPVCNAPQSHENGSNSHATGDSAMSTLERAFLSTFKLLAPDYPLPEAEYRFHAKRRWRFDFAWPDYKVACELEGGVWSRGRHVRGKGFISDIEKYNSAVLNGWAVLRYHKVTPDAITQVTRLLDMRKDKVA